MPKQHVITASSETGEQGPHLIELRAVNGPLGIQALGYGYFRLWHLPSGLYARRELPHEVNTLRHAKRILNILAADPGWLTVDTKEANPELARLAGTIDPAIKQAWAEEQEYLSAYYERKRWARSA